MAKIELVPPLTFRLYQSIRFNRPINKKEDYISPGGYEVTMKDKDGKEKDVQFDFEDYEGSIDDKDPTILHCMQKNPDMNAFEDLETVTEHMLRNITKVTEWFVYTGEPDEVKDNPLIPVEVIDPEFEIINDFNNNVPDDPKVKITVPVTPDCGIPKAE